MPKSKCAVVVYIDHREKRGLQKTLDLPKFKRVKARVKWRQLDSGDIRIVRKCADGERRVLAAIERKTADDLLQSSVGKGSRLHEQKTRLLQENPTRLLYLIEGKPSYHAHKRWEKRGGAAVNVERLTNELVREDGVHVLTTASAERTVRELEKWMEKATREEEEEEDDDNPASRSEGKTEVSPPLLGIKREELTPQRLLYGTLAAVPGVRRALAATLAEEFGTLANFIQSSTTDTLERTPYTCGVNKKNCQLGKAVAERIAKLFSL